MAYRFMATCPCLPGIIMLALLLGLVLERVLVDAVNDSLCSAEAMLFHVHAHISGCQQNPETIAGVIYNNLTVHLA